MIKKLIIKMVIVPALILGGFGYISYTNTGKIPFMDGNGFDFGGSSSGQSTKQLRAKITSKNTSSSKQTFVKWQDESGQWHYGMKAPEGVKTRSIDYDPGRNVVSAVKVTASKLKESKFGMPSSTSDSKSGGLAGMLTGDASDAYKPENIAKTISDAQNLQKTLNDRMKKQQEMLENLR